jgi:P4 family phage/plasmid primase-like protien
MSIDMGATAVSGNGAAKAMNDPVAAAKSEIEELALTEDPIEFEIRLGQAAKHHKIPKTTLNLAVINRRRQMQGLPVSVFARGSDVEIAQWIASKLREHRGDVPFANGEFWYHDSTHWRPITAEEMRRSVHELDGAPLASGKQICLSKPRIDGILNELAILLAQPGYFDKAPHGINCASGFIEFDASGKPTQHGHSPDHRQRHVLPGRWKPSSRGKPPRRSLLHKLLSGCFKGDPDGDNKKAVLQEVVGAAAAGIATRVTEPKALVLWGDQAGNGKGQIADAMRGLLPKDAVSAVSPGELGDQHARVDLANSLLNISDELSTAHAIASDKFKSIVTGDPISARSLYKARFEFRPEAQHCYCANSLPSFSGGMDRGTQRRLLVMKLLRTIPKGERIEHLGQKVAQQEPDLLLAWAVEGASRLLARGHFEEPQWATDALNEWTTMADPVIAWCDGRVEYAPGKKIGGAEAYNSFTVWTREQGYRPSSLPARNAFTQRAHAELSKRGIRYGSSNGLRGFFDAQLKKAESSPGINAMTRAFGAELAAAAD